MVAYLVLAPSSCISALQVILDLPGQIGLLLRFWVSRWMQLIIWQFILYVLITYLCVTGERGSYAAFTLIVGHQRQSCRVDYTHRSRNHFTGKQCYAVLIESATNIGWKSQITVKSYESKWWVDTSEKNNACSISHHPYSHDFLSPLLSVGTCFEF